ncbi:MAG: mercury resistance system transport protein MerF [Alphaproteobacteria bacterium]|nr:mercury resistance system transport protein MerF [Alphaproteobacteria bacterium]
MNERLMFRVGLTGAIATAVCCVTPILPFGLALLGLGAWSAGLDYILLPMLVFFGAMAGLALARKRSSAKISGSGGA